MCAFICIRIYDGYFAKNKNLNDGVRMFTEHVLQCEIKINAGFGVFLQAGTLQTITSISLSIYLLYRAQRSPREQLLSNGSIQ